LGVDAAQRDVADFCPRVAEQVAAYETSEPLVAFGAWQRVDHVLDESKVATQCLREIRIGGTEFDQQTK
jgi:hypothetical protein